MIPPYTLLKLLADNDVHPLDEIAALSASSHPTVMEAVAALSLADIPVEDVAGGYRLTQPIELLDAASILRCLDADTRNLLSGLEIHAQLDSTNSYLLAHGIRKGWACFAEHQSAGRGRRGRPWISPCGNIAMSLCWRFDNDVRIEGLSLAAGVAAISALEAAGVHGCALKWPNDILWHGRKLAGILVERSGSGAIVLGIGVNMYIPTTSANTPDQAWADITSIAADLGRNRLAGLLLHEMLAMFARFEREGFLAFRPQWNAYDLLAQRDVVLRMPHGEVSGKALGIDNVGALLVESKDRISSYTVGDVSVRTV